MKEAQYLAIAVFIIALAIFITSYRKLNRKPKRIDISDSTMEDGTTIDNNYMEVDEVNISNNFNKGPFSFSGNTILGNRLTEKETKLWRTLNRISIVITIISGIIGLITFLAV